MRCRRTPCPVMGMIPETGISDMGIRTMTACRTGTGILMIPTDIINRMKRTTIMKRSQTPPRRIWIIRSYGNLYPCGRMILMTAVPTMGYIRF